jgi:hypothetical protein
VGVVRSELSGPPKYSEYLYQTVEKSADLDQDQWRWKRIAAYRKERPLNRAAVRK